MRRFWPDLVLRAKIAKNWPGKREGWSPPVSSFSSKSTAPSASPSSLVDVLVALIEKAVEENVGAGKEMTEDEYVVHLKDCVGCRRNVASLARMGVKIPSKILVAAGVEVLN